jgi:hypothetical protein
MTVSEGYAAEREEACNPQLWAVKAVNWLPVAGRKALAPRTFLHIPVWSRGIGTPDRATVRGEPCGEGDQGLGRQLVSGASSTTAVIKKAFFACRSSVLDAHYRRIQFKSPYAFREAVRPRVRGDV